MIALASRGSARKSRFSGLIRKVGAVERRISIQRYLDTSSTGTMCHPIPQLRPRGQIGQDTSPGTDLEFGLSLHLNKVTELCDAGRGSSTTDLSGGSLHTSRTVRDARMEAVSRVTSGLTDINRRVFCLLTYVQALLDHGFGHKDYRWYEYDVGWLPHCDQVGPE